VCIEPTRFRNMRSRVASSNPTLFSSLPLIKTFNSHLMPPKRHRKASPLSMHGSKRARAARVSPEIPESDTEPNARAARVSPEIPDSDTEPHDNSSHEANPPLKILQSVVARFTNHLQEVTSPTRNPASFNDGQSPLTSANQDLVRLPMYYTPAYTSVLNCIRSSLPSHHLMTSANHLATAYRSSSKLPMTLRTH
jgi:hypothetical protein